MVTVKIGGPGKRTLIESFGTVFPVLLCESIKGFMELFSSHGLPDKKESAEYVMKKADNVESEYWNTLLGPEMWNLFSNTLGDMDMKYLPLLFTKVSELNGNDFCEFIEEIFGRTKKGKEMMMSIVDEVVNEIDYDDFEDALGMDKNMISDEYLTPEDLDLI